MSSLMPCLCGGIAVIERSRSGVDWFYRIRCSNDKCPVCTDWGAPKDHKIDEWNKKVKE